MNWSLLLVSGLTVFITVIALWWIWAESKPGNFLKGGPKPQTGTSQMKEWGRSEWDFDMPRASSHPCDRSTFMS